MDWGYYDQGGKMNKEEGGKIIVDPANTKFAKTMQLLTWVALLILVIPGVLYFFGIHDLVDVNTVSENWDKSAPDFWEFTTGDKVGGYTWFGNHLSYVDGLTIIGVAFLALVPLFSAAFALPKAVTKHKVILAVMMIEFVIAIIRPLVLGGGGA
jgi:hypothetical protein